MGKLISIKGDELYDAADMFDMQMQLLLCKMDKASAVEGKVGLTVTVELEEVMRTDVDTGELVKCYVPRFRCKAKSTVMLSEEENLKSEPAVVLRHRKGDGWTTQEDNGGQIGMEDIV